MYIKRFVLAFLLVLAPFAAMASAPGVHPVSPDTGLKMLTEGNLRFALGQSTHPNTSFSRRLLTTTEGQAPFATVIACSDSRVPVEILFDQGVGDLFVIKVAGNVADTDEIGSAEYGVDHLGTPVLMVLGHTYCGAVTAVTTGAEVHGSIPALVDNIVPAVEKARHEHPDADTPELIVKAIEANVWQAIEDLLGKSHAIADRAKDGRVVVVGAVYDILTGKVNILGTHPRQTELLGGVTPPAHADAAMHAEPAKDVVAHAEPAHAEPAHAEPADAAHTEPAVEKAKAEGHGEAAEAPSSGGFGFFSFIVFVLLLIGAVFVLDKKILNPDQN
ncbi:carbonic anhydrase [Desulfomicrobium norvegicum]|uniref:carbonic anhydrase n=1 Tax=Desulfomicrobium norvegicum (strain DSM 1741 / NCIMB 8310) TaxID=52561 RepID=A0A8G2C5U2_DESNO|nr:carbonic anhydrase [Desulfomicrobium norvegicum]SFM16097.1 carbonic anhydrase [Desulfomicrobium norvegicum]